MEGRHFDDFFSQDFSHFALLRLLCSLHDYHLTSLSSRSDLRSRDRKSDGSFFFFNRVRDGESTSFWRAISRWWRLFEIFWNNRFPITRVRAVRLLIKRAANERKDDRNNYHSSIKRANKKFLFFFTGTIKMADAKPLSAV